jgi:uncharacterized protein
MERRFYTNKLEIRSEPDNSEPAKLVGYAAVFGEISTLLYGQFHERIERGAFASALTGDVVALWNHDPALVLGRSTAGTLALAEDAHGLRVEITPPDTQAGRDAVALIRRGDVDRMSFGFNVLDDTWDKTPAGALVRTLRKVELFEVSAVTFPAYVGTAIAARSELATMGELPTIPAHLISRLGGATDRSSQALAEIRRRRLAFLERI